MIMKKGTLSILLLFVLAASIAQHKKDDFSIKDRLQVLSSDNILKTKGYHNWGGSIIKGKDGKYHLFYSRWKDTHSAWLTFSEIAHAVSDKPSGPWAYKETVLKGRGKGHWDAVTAHNPKIKYFDGKYYLYYISTNLGKQDFSDQDLIDTHGKSLRNSPTRKQLRENQRTGVAYATSLNGPWTRLDHPIIEPSGPITTLTVNPAIDKGADGKYYLIVKGDKPNETRFIRNQAIAVADTPIGPFKMSAKPVIDYKDTEDMSIWYDEKRKRFYGVYHAHKYIGLVTSINGIDWEPAKEDIIMKKRQPLHEGGPSLPYRMERPFIFFEEGVPKVLCLAIGKGHESFSVFVPIVGNP
jgi:hypothetical protein